MGNLQDLAKHRKDILLAEVAAWLHDWKKCSDEHLKVVLGNNYRQYRTEFRRNCPSFTPSPAQGLPKTDFSRRFFPHFSSETVNDLCRSSSPISMERVVSEGRRGREDTSLSVVIWLLRKAHHSAHMEKELEDRELEGLQCTYTPKSSTVFGFERREISGLTAILAQIGPVIQDRSHLFSLLYPLWHKAVGDTRRPINEVTLWDWSSVVAALYKAELARCVLTGQSQQPQDVAWRLLSIRTDGIGYMLSAPSIPDLLARKDLLTNAWDRVQKVVEEDYPLGLEVYRDENGPVYVVPDLENLLGLENPEDNHKTLREYLLDAFRAGTVKDNPCLAIDGEIVPAFKLDKKPWKGQPAPKELPPIGEHLKQQIPLQSDPIAIAQPWCHHNEEICTICGLRPQGPSPKAKGRKMCDVCEERRTDRAKDWAANLGSTFLSTIWLSEVADAHHRLALIVGQFDLTHWLSGTLVRSLAVRTPNNQNGHTEDQVAKNPSFARLRRIWETIHRFWQTIAPTETPPKELVAFCQQNGLNLEDLWDGPLSLEKSVIGQAIGNAGPRLLIQGMLQPRHPKETPAPYHTYELRLGRVKIGMLWDPKRQGFVTLENLVYIAKQLGDKMPKPQSREGKQETKEEKERFREALNRWASEVVQQEIQSQRTLTIEEPAGYGGRNKEWGTIEIQEVERLPQPYVPVVSILAEPRTFMALVPADKAVDVVQAIRTKYEREMGKVRNRLPLHLGVVFADAHTPLRAILDAGRRMLKQQSHSTLWRVVGEREKRIAKKVGLIIEQVTQKDLPEEDLESKRPQLIYRKWEKKEERVTEQFKKWHRIVLLSEERFRRCLLTWYVPAVMGDGSTEDHWYPYVFWEQDKDGSTDPGSATTQRTRYYQAPNPFNPDADGKPQLGWLVHAGELEPGDKVYFTPATLDFQWLDSSASRFEIAYDESGRRRGSLHRPYLLDELDDLQKCWQLLAGDKRLTNTQIHQVRDLIEAKRREWFPENPQDSLKDATFRQFCRDVLKNAEWGEAPSSTDIKRLTNWAVSGVLTDAVELFAQILKRKAPEGGEA